MFAVFLISVFASAHVVAEIPSYIRVCDYKNQLNQCIIDNVHNLRSKLCEGIPELDVPPIDLWPSVKLTIIDSPNLNLSLNADISGFCSYHLNYLIYDIDTNHVEFEVTFKKIKINGTYDLNILVVVPIQHKGNIYISTENLKTVSTFDMKVVTNRGKRYMYISKMKTTIDIKDYNATYNQLTNNTSDSTEVNQLQQVLDNLTGSNKQEIIKLFKPALEKRSSQILISAGNKIAKHFTYNELFPGRP